MEEGLLGEWANIISSTSFIYRKHHFFHILYLHTPLGRSNKSAIIFLNAMPYTASGKLCIGLIWHARPLFLVGFPRLWLCFYRMRGVCVPSVCSGESWPDFPMPYINNAGIAGVGGRVGEENSASCIIQNPAHFSALSRSAYCINWSSFASIAAILDRVPCRVLNWFIIWHDHNHTSQMFCHLCDYKWYSRRKKITNYSPVRTDSNWIPIHVKCI